jgi:hypothetical protein
MLGESTIIFIPFLCGILFFALLFGFLGYVRYLQYRETINLAEKGLIKLAANGKVEVRGNGHGTLRWGVVIASLGLALTLGLWPLGINTMYWLGIGPWMIGGFIPLFFGLGLILVYVITREDDKKEKAGDEGGAPPTP